MPARWAWPVDGRAHGRPATVHAEGCSGATDRAHPLGTMQALDALAPPARPPAPCATPLRLSCRSSPTARTTPPPPATDRVRRPGKRRSRSAGSRVRRRASPETEPSHRARPRQPGG
ncbi:DUF6233 domain-containing protein [Streptomyces nojiriensis]|uniref:DUF6233 domain-containing protein n=1 Tax=Streptomyces nojiriensis TaxID=66374 RepID=UPI0035DA72E5